MRLHRACSYAPATVEGARLSANYATAAESARFAQRSRVRRAGELLQSAEGEPAVLREFSFGFIVFLENGGKGELNVTVVGTAVRYGVLQRV